MLDSFLRRGEELDLPRAVCALLVAAARADGVFERDEAGAVAGLVAEQFGYSPQETAVLVTAVAAEERLDLFPVARWLVENVSRAQRNEVLRLMWRVVFSDGRLEAREDVLMHRVGKLLELPHRDVIALKLAAREGG